MSTATSTPTRQYRDSTVDVKIVLSALWIAMLFVFAYVDIFGLFRADVLEAALNGKAGTTDFTVNQGFLAGTLIYIAIPTLMVVLSLLLRARVNRVTQIIVAAVYIVTIAASMVGEDWAYYLIGSVIEMVLLLAVIGFAWKWPTEG